MTPPGSHDKHDTSYNGIYRLFYASFGTARKG